MNAAIFMAQAYGEDMLFYLGSDGSLQMEAPDDVYDNPELMAMIQEHKAGVLELLAGGFDCVRDKLTYREKKHLVAVAQRGEGNTLEAIE